jgi:hypothetical protein
MSNWEHIKIQIQLTKNMSLEALKQLYPDLKMTNCGWKDIQQQFLSLTESFQGSEGGSHFFYNEQYPNAFSIDGDLRDAD